MYPFLEELFVRGAVRLFLGLELHEIYAHKQHEHRDENYGGKRVHIGLNRFFVIAYILSGRVTKSAPVV